VNVVDFDLVHYARVNTPPLFGMGQLEKIPDWAIRAHGASRLANVISRELAADFSQTKAGRLRTVAGRAGKFGWKGQFASVEDFVAVACAVELGLSNPRRGQDAPGEFRPDRNAGLDLDKKQFRALVAYGSNLPAPVEVVPEDEQERTRAEHGKVLFEKVGCAVCHTPELGGVAGVYSDFMVYKLDRKSTDGSYVQSANFEMPSHHPEPGEWKTPPLWGVADSAPYFHDGQSPTPRAAINRHDGDARQSRKKFGSSEESVGKNDCRVTTGPPLRLDRGGPPFAPLPSHQPSIDGAKG